MKGEIVTVGEFGDKRTPAQAVVDMLEESKAESAKLAVVVILDDDGTLHSSWSDGHLHEIMGMLEMAKLRIRNIQDGVV